MAPGDNAFNGKKDSGNEKGRFTPGKSLLTMPKEHAKNRIRIGGQEDISLPGEEVRPHKETKPGRLERFLKWLARGAEASRSSGASCPT